MIEGKDYIILKRFRVTDEYGFNQPVEVSSFVLPANWQVNGSVQWNGRKNVFLKWYRHLYKQNRQMAHLN